MSAQCSHGILPSPPEMQCNREKEEECYTVIKQQRHNQTAGTKGCSRDQGTRQSPKIRDSRLRVL